MILCYGCDRAVHEFFPDQHQKRIMDNYTGCPSAQHFEKLLGYDTNHVDGDDLEDHLASSSCVSVDPSSTKLNSLGSSSSEITRSSSGSPANSAVSVIIAECAGGSISQQNTIYGKDHLQRNAYLIKQQIADLKKLQLTRQNNRSSLFRGEGQSDTSSSLYNASEKLDESLHSYAPNLDDPVDHHLQYLNTLNQELKGESFPSSISQLEQLHGDPFLQCKSSTYSSQFLSQNLQELGVCEELVCFDNFNMPDVVGTFSNFEEFFCSDQDLTTAFLDDNNFTWSSMDESFSIDNTENKHTRANEAVSASSASAPVDKHAIPSDEAHPLSRSMNSALPIQQSSSAAFHPPRHRVKGSGSDWLDNEQSGNFVSREPACGGGDASCLENAIRSCRRRMGR
ncbi:hypothetical protein Nepgr_028081 [Nepenthes gracilis]|uniref:Uncharacterized protein n=1 Tax=Nepenthes gracilis TaxID=150966 RepID=A0AAD3T9Z9_NEPGR|nr:hypothetical protein Nepgr_028081 [Nepenthes gracilis]